VKQRREPRGVLVGDLLEARTELRVVLLRVEVDAVALLDDVRGLVRGLVQVGTAAEHDVVAGGEGAGAHPVRGSGGLGPLVGHDRSMEHRVLDREDASERGTVIYRGGLSGGHQLATSIGTTSNGSIRASVSSP
jgi:hypothetical protein